jgi:spermidine synthase
LAIGKRKKVLEIGVGIGLYIQELLEINPQQYEIWGIDNNEPYTRWQRVTFRPPPYKLSTI